MLCVSTFGDAFVIGFVDGVKRAGLREVDGIECDSERGRRRVDVANVT